MPIYEYRCDECLHEFEEQQEVSDKPINTCPKCNKETVERLISRTMGFCRNVTTLGQLAEKNMKKMGKEKLQIEEDKLKPQKEIKEIRKLGSLTNEQKRKYIERGIL